MAPGTLGHPFRLFRWQGRDLTFLLSCCRWDVLCRSPMQGEGYRNTAATCSVMPSLLNTPRATPLPVGCQLVHNCPERNPDLLRR